MRHDNLATLAAACAALLVGLCATSAPGNIVFLESFDGPTLPGTLTYSEVPPNMTWSISGGQLLADSDGTLNTTINAITNDGFTSPTASYPMVYSLDLGIPAGSSAGSYNVGLEFGGYRAVFHPGYVPIPGAFRMEGGFSAGNQDMGFVPKMGELHHLEAEVWDLGTSLGVNITITGLGTDDLLHQFNYSFVDSSPNLGTGTIGARRSGGGGSSDAFFDNLQAVVIPEPSTLLVWSVLAGLGIGAEVRRRRRPKTN
jgi:hypothetical protein